MTRIPIGVAVAALLVSAGSGEAAHRTNEQSSAPYFVTPSRNIVCSWNAGFDNPARTFLRCQIGTGLNPRPRRPASCEFDWAYGLTMMSTGAAEPICASDSNFAGWRPILPYGATWRKRGFVCRLRESGLTCRNRSDHGFFLSRERWRLLKPRR